MRESVWILGLPLSECVGMTRHGLQAWLTCKCCKGRDDFALAGCGSQQRLRIFHFIWSSAADYVSMIIPYPCVCPLRFPTIGFSASSGSMLLQGLGTKLDANSDTVENVSGGKMPPAASCLPTSPFAHGEVAPDTESSPKAVGKRPLDHDCSEQACCISWLSLLHAINALTSKLLSLQVQKERTRRCWRPADTNSS